MRAVREAISWLGTAVVVERVDRGEPFRDSGNVGDALNGRMALKVMALLVILKLFGASTSYASGNAGGIFGPSLFIGAMLGGTVGSIAHRLLPTFTATPGAYALVGMGTAFAGIVRAPMTSVLMIFETTRDYTVIVPGNQHSA